MTISTNPQGNESGKLIYLLKVSDVARMTQISPSQVYTMIREGSLPAVRFCTALRVRLEDLQKFIKEFQKEEVHFPRNPIQPEIDGRITSYYEWLGAGHLVESITSGAMHQQQGVVVTDFYFGWDRNNLYLRLDLDPVCAEEDGFLFRLNFGSAGQWSFKAENGKIIPQSYPFPIAQDTIIEVAFPWKELNLVSGSGLEFYLEIRRDNHILKRLPRQGSLNLTIPGEDYEESFWR